MNKQTILETLSKIKPLYAKDGLVLLGLFGSYARDEASESSDIDILIETTPLFLEKYKGFKAFNKLDSLKEDLKAIFHKEIDFVDKTGLLQHNNEYILEKTLYVS